MVLAVAMRIRRNVGVEQPRFALAYRNISFLQLHAAIHRALHLRTGQSDPGFIPIGDVIVVKGRAIGCQHFLFLRHAVRTLDQCVAPFNFRSKTSCRVMMPVIRPYSSTSTAGLVCSLRKTSFEAASTSTIGKLDSITSLTADSNNARSRTTFDSTRFSRTEPTELPSAITGSCVSPSSSIFSRAV